MSAVKERIREIIADELGREINESDDDKSVIELGADSLHCVEIIVALEEEFSLSIQDQEAEQMKTVSEIADYLESHDITG